MIPDGQEPILPETNGYSSDFEKWWKNTGYQVFPESMKRSLAFAFACGRLGGFDEAVKLGDNYMEGYDAGFDAGKSEGIFEERKRNKQ